MNGKDPVQEQPRLKDEDVSEKEPSGTKEQMKEQPILQISELDDQQSLMKMMDTTLKMIVMMQHQMQTMQNQQLPIQIKQETAAEQLGVKPCVTEVEFFMK